MKWYEFRQNNSGGSFDTEYGHSVFVQADNYEEANHLAEVYGLYFNGIDSGLDCPCCGNRWYEQWHEPDEDVRTDVPTAYLSRYDIPRGSDLVEGETTDLQAAANCDMFFSKGETVFSLYYKDGRVERVKKEVK